MFIKKLSLILTAIIFSITTILLSGCSGEVNRSKELQEAMNEIDEGLTSSFSQDTCDFDMLREYLNSWAKSSDITVVENSSHYMVFLNPTTNDLEDRETIAMQCSVNVNSPSNSFYVLGTAMAAILGPENHGDIYLIVTESEGKHRIGAASVDKKYLDAADNLIELSNAGSVSVYTRGGRTAEAVMTAKSKKKEPKYSEAYTITMTIPEYTDPYNFEKSNNYPDPVETIGSLLASAKSSGRLFEIASFSSKSHDGYTPYTATTTIVLDSNNVDNFTKRFDKSYSNISDKFEDLDDDFVYTFTKADMPSKVLSEKVSDNLISLMYTLNTGICIQDEDTGMVLASSYIDSISTKSGSLEMKVRIRARGDYNLNALSEEYSTTAGLCNTDYSLGGISSVWSSESGGRLEEYFTGLYPADEEGDSETVLKTYDADFLAANAGDDSLNMIICQFSNSDRNDILDNLLNFIDPDYHEDDEEQTAD